MRITLITDRPEHPVLAAMLDELDARHQVAVISAEGADPAALAAQEARALAGVYLLESHSPAALDLAGRLEVCGGTVVNGSAATRACQDRVLMARRLTAAGLPCPRTWSVPTLGRARRLLAALHFPLVVKSRFSRPGDLVTQVRSADEMEALMPRWGGEPVILQQYEDNDGWDVKLWVVGGHAFAARRPTPLLAGASRESVPIVDGELSPAWVGATLRAGREFDLSLYGVDLLVTARGPAIVDVNAFPGYRGVPGAAAALAAFIEGLSMEASATA
ncbi:MAG TPA: alpha-L-glutamate ligase [Candidatus Dormibacteraeota bacterium]|jgi:ribosomal protein S6--L-glutamate ligase